MGSEVDDWCPWLIFRCKCGCGHLRHFAHQERRPRSLVAIFSGMKTCRETQVLPRNGKKFRGRCGTAERGAAGRDPSYSEARIGIPVTPRNSVAETKVARRLRSPKGTAVREHGASGATCGGRDPSAFGHVTSLKNLDWGYQQSRVRIQSAVFPPRRSDCAP